MVGKVLVPRGRDRAVHRNACVAICAVITVTLAACAGGGGSDSSSTSDSMDPASGLRAKPSMYSGREDEVLRGMVAFDSAASGSETFVISWPPTHGELELDARSGHFIYRPSVDFFGEDEFEFEVRRPDGLASSAQVRLLIEAVNDPPKLAPIPDLANSPMEAVVSWQLEVIDPDHDPISLSVENSRPDVVTAQVASVEQRLDLVAHAVGEAEIRVVASDGQAEADARLSFRVERVVREVTFTLEAPSDTAIRITNSGDGTRRFGLGWNEFQIHESLASIVEQAEQRKLAGLQAPLPMQLWKLVRRGIYHHYSLTGQRWEHDPLVLFNSIGFGLCDDVAVALALLHRHAGHEVRVWALNGHVAPELQLDGRWVLLDPDIDISYQNRDGSLAGVTELAADTTLITDPTNPVREPVSSVYGYQPFMASIYGSTEDNVVEPWYLEGAELVSGIFELPAGGRLEFPGRWLAELRDSTGSTVPAFSTMRMVIPAGFSGEIALPLVLRRVIGLADVEIFGQLFTARDAALNEWLAANPYFIPSIRIDASESDVELILLLNPVGSALQNETKVRTLGPRVADLEFDRQVLTTEERVPDEDEIPVFPPPI